MTRTEIDELVLWAYEAELFGSALFAGLRNRATDKALRHELDLLRQLEDRTAALLGRYLHRHDIALPESGPPSQRGTDAAAAADNVTLDEMLKRIIDVVPTVIERYTRLGELLEESEACMVNDLVEHERALGAYAYARRTGCPDPIAPVRAILLSYE